MTVFSDRCAREDEEDRLTALDALMRMHEGWFTAGCPGSVEQLTLFSGFTIREVERARQVDRPRRRKRA
jgi:hypothetical protein